MTGGTTNWDDLSTRISTAAILALVGGIAIWVGGLWFLALILLAGATMIWELAGIVAPRQRVEAILLSALTFSAATVFIAASGIVGFWALMAMPVLGAVMLRQGRATFFLYGLAIVFACSALVVVRSNFGLAPFLWIILVVIATDLAGYFAGRMLGGPKFWPRISPKKTWSGTVTGWIAAALVGAVMMKLFGFTGPIILASVLLSFASQMGDIGESAIKRRAGVKDSSDLLPGHGGVLDRFDGMIGAGVLLAIVLPLFWIAGPS